MQNCKNDAVPEWKKLEGCHKKRSGLAKTNEGIQVPVMGLEEADRPTNSLCSD